MASEIDELRDKLKDIDLKYYKNLDDETISAPSKDIAKEVVRELLRKSEEFFHKGTREDAALGVFYRKIAKDILDTL